MLISSQRTFLTFLSRKYIRFFSSSKFSLIMSSSSSVVKPPNVLVYTAENNFKNVSETLSKCTDKYLVYRIKREQVLNSPWMENAVLLLVLSDDIEENIAKKFVEYVKKGGNLIAICSNLKASGICDYKLSETDVVKVGYKDLGNVNLCRGKYILSAENGCILAADDKNNPMISKVKLEEGTMIVSSIYLGFNTMSDIVPKTNSKASLCILKNLLIEELNLDCSISEKPVPSSGYVIVENDSQIEDMMKFMSISDISLKPSSKLPSDIDLKVPLLFHYEGLNSSLFDKAAYYSTLKTKLFGKTIVFFPVVTSTMYPAEHLSDHPGIVIIANRQIAGKGRGQNLWLSPEGSASFTLHFPLMLSSKLGQRMSLLQHMASLAFVHGLRKREGYEELNFRLKWPNDIFFETDKKIGGVLVNTTIQGDVAHAYIGIGLNIANEHPTVSVNSVINNYNTKHEKSLAPLKIEEAIAFTLSELESLVNDLINSKISKFLDLYYKYWIHQDQNITLASSNEKASVRGIDEFGFLIVETNEKKKLSLQPDGNRFDIMKNLIVAKELEN